MCRYFAYHGEPVPLSRWLFEGSHSLERQAYRPREMVSGEVNVDGTGVAWWTAGEPTPMRYVFDGPPWADPNLPALAPRIASGTQLAVVRSATAGIGHGAGHLQPYVHPGAAVAVAHNGWIGGFRGTVGQRMVSALAPALFETLPALNDSAVLFCAIAERLLDGADPADALRSVIRETLALCRAHGQSASLNLAVSTAQRTVAARSALGVRSNSLHVSVRAHGCLLASEPLDEGGWEAVPPEHLVDLTASAREVTEL